jgi:hypothetical protein
MDANRFDTLARSLTTAGSRRRALALALSGAVGLLALAHADDAVAGGECKPKCKECNKCKKGTCKDGKCKKGKCKPTPTGTGCRTGTCASGSCVAAAPPPPPPGPTCKSAQQVCANDCCAPMVCADNFCTAASNVCCGNPGVACGAHCDCCGVDTFCLDNGCDAGTHCCGTESASCEGSCDCCAVFSCSERDADTCQVCSFPQDICTDESDCCLNDSTCGDNGCVDDDVCCQGENAFCFGDCDCCAAFVCNDNNACVAPALTSATKDGGSARSAGEQESPRSRWRTR